MHTSIQIHTPLHYTSHTFNIHTPHTTQTTTYTFTTHTPHKYSIELVRDAHEALVAELGVRAAGHTGMDKCGISALQVAYVAYLNVVFMWFYWFMGLSVCVCVFMFTLVVVLRGRTSLGVLHGTHTPHTPLHTHTHTFTYTSPYTHSKWTDEEIEQFHKGISAVGRDFVKLQRTYLPERALYEVVEFYYNVWKLKWLPISRAWAEKEAEVCDRRLGGGAV